MIDQNILYAECPCGSGKKFKFCCYPVVRGELPRDPSRADVTAAIRRHSHTARFAEHAVNLGIVDVDRYQDLIGRGLRALHDRSYKEARETFLEAKGEFDMLPTAYNNLALCALVQGDLKEAEEWTQEVIRRFPVENPFGMAMHADIKYLKGDLVGALDVIKRAEAIEPPYADQAARLCESMAHFKDHERIVRYAEKSGFADAPEIAYFRGIALANLGRNSEAKKALRLAVRSQQGDYAQSILEDVIAGRHPSTICGDWSYFRHDSFTLFGGLMNGVMDGGEQQLELSSEVMAEFIEVETNEGLMDVSTAIKLVSSLMCKRTERMLDSLRLDVSRPEAVRKAADRAYKKLFAKNGVGKRLQEISTAGLQHMIITEEAATHLSIDPAYEEDYFKAVNICLDPESKRSDLKEALRLFADLHEKLPDNPAISNNYASALSRCGRMAEAIEITRECFAQHPDYVFGAANYLGMLVYCRKIEEAKAMIENYRLPQRIHPEAYLAWCRSEMRFFTLVGDEEHLRNVQETMKLVQNGIRRKED